MNKNIIIVGAIAVGLYLMSQGKKSTMAVVKKKAPRLPHKYIKPKTKRVIAKKKAKYNKPKIKKAVAKKKKVYKKSASRVAIAKKQQIKRMQGGRKRMQSLFTFILILILNII